MVGSLRYTKLRENPFDDMQEHVGDVYTVKESSYSDTVSQSRNGLVVVPLIGVQ